MSMERRELIQILAAVPALAQTGAAYKPRFFSAEEYAFLDEFTEALIPSEPGSPGARAANVGYFIDTVIHWNDETVKSQWRKGMAAIRALGLSPAAAVAKLVASETRPTTDAERFFVALKRMTIDAFCQSELVQKQVFGYTGNHAVKDFPGCA